jgi:hypothetical protein
MDDFDVSSLHESRNEWSARLITILTPLIIDGYKSIIEEAIKLCRDNNEMEKYLMTFQNFVSRIPKWNSTIIETERKRICDKSGCLYLEDLVTCVHIIQLKMLTAVRVGHKQKKIDINIPKLDDFIHKVYINVARKVYKNVYLFELGIPPLQIQKHNRELEIIVQECILNTLRESIPVEAILKEYMTDESIEEDVTEEIKEQIIEETPVNKPIENVISNPDITKDDNKNPTKLKFDDIDYVKDSNNTVTSVSAPKSIERLNELSEMRAKSNEQESIDDDEKLKITNEDIVLNDFDVIDEPVITFPELNKDEIEIEFDLFE